MLFLLSSTSTSRSAMRDCKAAASWAKADGAEERAKAAAQATSPASPQASPGALEERAEETKEEISARDDSSTSSRKLRMDVSLSCGGGGREGVRDREGACEVGRGCCEEDEAAGDAATALLRAGGANDPVDDVAGAVALPICPST
mmetsp:Transcript_56397/g.121527  ORF Transcript_56397/g.121527 Transcript_56397/m.121527 type:complete len:146 (+) Transcript_56397:1562-1999(+)